MISSPIRVWLDMGSHRRGSEVFCCTCRVWSLVILQTSQFGYFSEMREQIVISTWFGIVGLRLQRRALPPRRSQLKAVLFSQAVFSWVIRQSNFHRKVPSRFGWFLHWHRFSPGRESDLLLSDREERNEVVGTARGPSVSVGFPPGCHELENSSQSRPRIPKVNLPATSRTSKFRVRGCTPSPLLWMPFAVWFSRLCSVCRIVVVSRQRTSCSSTL